jgi:hypothetical protein
MTGTRRSRIVFTMLVAALALGMTAGTALARPYKITRSKATGWFHWECKDGSAEGWSETRPGARDAASAACGGSSYTITDPDPDGLGPVLDREQYLACRTEALDGTVAEHAPDVVDEGSCRHHFGLPLPEGVSLTGAAQVRVALIAWGIYLGGDDEETLRSRHNLTGDEYLRVAERDYEDAVVDIEPDRPYLWSFR